MQQLGAEAVLGPLAGDLASAALVLARRFASGATLWCWSPDQPEHGRHVAVEFVHPVIVGKRALPAVAVDAIASEAADRLRPVVASGDVVLALGRDPAMTSVLRRAAAWGALTIWMGTGPRPEPGAADAVLWLDEAGPLAGHDGSIVLLYHLLWELTHVCFEHPGLLDGSGDAGECTTTACVTCSDEGRLGEVLETGDGGTATVRTAGGTERVDTMAVGDVEPGALLLIHAGSAISLVEAAG